jgi:HNH endonuclease
MERGGRLARTPVRGVVLSAPQLLWRRANKATLDTLRGESRGQYDIRLGRKKEIAGFFEGLPQTNDHQGTRFDLWTEPEPLADATKESAPWKLQIRRMGERSIRRDFYIRAQRPETAHPLWRPGTGPLDETEPETDYAVLLRTSGDRFYAGWLRSEQIESLPEDVRERMTKAQVGARTLAPKDAEAVLVALGQETEEAEIVSGGEPPQDEGQGPPPLDPDVAEEMSAQEGQPKLVQHKRRERSRSLRKKRIEQAGESLVCEACGFNFEQIYGDRGRGFIECHHTTPLSQIDPATPTRLEDLALLCANCHRMVHRQPWLTVDDLKKLLAEEAPSQ